MRSWERTNSVKIYIKHSLARVINTNVVSQVNHRALFDGEILLARKELGTNIITGSGACQRHFPPSVIWVASPKLPTS